MRVLVLGGSGMAGHLISLYFKEQGYDVTTLSTKSFALCKNVVGNALDFEGLDPIVRFGNYDVVINCIGILNQFAESNPMEARKINTELPLFIANIANQLSCKFIHMSTDCVFAGNTGPYKENSIKDGLSVYDKTKAAGEVVGGNNLTFRNSIIGPDIKENGIGLFNWFMKQQGEVFGFTEAIWTGVTTLTLAKAMEAAIMQNLCGLYNLVNNASISKYELLTLFNEYCKKESLSVIPSDRLKLDKTLICTRTDFKFTVPTYEQMIIEMKEWIDRHQNIYPKFYYL